MPKAKTRTKQPARRKRKLIHPLSRQRQQKPLSRPQLIAREQILNQLHDLITACEELFEQHGEACACEACCVVSNMVGSLFRTVLEIS
jgi:hypothetical protein